MLQKPTPRFGIKPRVKATKKQVAGLLKTAGITRKTFTDPRDGSLWLDRIKVLVMEPEPGICMIPELGYPGTKLNWLMVVTPQAYEDLLSLYDPEKDNIEEFWKDVLAEFDIEEFWKDVLAEFDQSTVTPPSPWSQVNEQTKVEEFLELMGYSESREQVVQRWRDEWDRSKEKIDGVSFEDFVGDDPWIGYVEEDEGL